MPTTTNYGWTTPADTDLVKDGASAIRTLGTAIDTTVFNNAGAAIAKTIVDAKGDIIAATAADTVARLAVGSNGQYLKANSSTSTGLEWATVAASPASATTRVNTSESTSSTTYTALTTAQSVTLTTGTKVLVLISSYLRKTGDNEGAMASYEITGATTTAVSDTWSVNLNVPSGIEARGRFTAASYQTVTAGSNTFTMLFKRQGSGGSVFFQDREITVIDLGS